MIRSLSLVLALCLAIPAEAAIKTDTGKFTSTGDATPITIKGNAAATGSVGVILDNKIAQTGGKAVSVRTGGAEVAAFDYSGRLTAIGVTSTAGLTSSGGAISLGVAALSFTVSATTATAGAGLRIAASRIINANKSVAPVDVSGGVTLSVTQVLDGSIFTSTGTATIVMPTFQGASGVIQGLPGTPAVGDIFRFTVACSHASQVVTITPGAGQTLFGIATTAAGGGSRTWSCRVTGITASSETATCY